MVLLIMSLKQRFIPRVNQMDAIVLDKEITQMIRENFLENIQAIAPAFFIKVQPELNLLIHTALWLGSIGKQHASFGQQLLLLTYDSKKVTKAKLILHYCLTVLPTYIKSYEKLRSSQIRNSLMKICSWMENITMFLSVLNLFRFLKYGRKPLLVDFILNLEYINKNENHQRNIGYHYMTRELLWCGFIEFLGLVLPLINVRKIKQTLENVVKKKKNNWSNTKQSKEKVRCLATTLCEFCNERPTLPHYIDCGHIYCYYCLTAHMDTDSIFYCTKCHYACTNESFIKSL